jgi:hypothetical protein
MIKNVKRRVGDVNQYTLSGDVSNISFSQVVLISTIICIGGGFDRNLLPACNKLTLTVRKVSNDFDKETDNDKLGDL